MADLQQLAGFAHRLHHGTRAVNGVAHHLFAIDMQSGLQERDGDGRVPEIRRGHHDRLQIFFVREQVFVVFVAFHVEALALEPADIAVAVVIPNVNDGDEIDAFNDRKRVEQHLALRAAADECDVDLVERGSFGGGTFRAGIRAARGPQPAGADGGGRADELPAVDGLLYHFLRSASLLCFASIKASATSATWIPSQEMPSSCLIKISPTVSAM